MTSLLANSRWPGLPAHLSLGIRLLAALLFWLSTSPICPSLFTTPWKSCQSAKLDPLLTNWLLTFPLWRTQLICLCKKEGAVESQLQLWVRTFQPQGERQEKYKIFLPGNKLDKYVKSTPYFKYHTYSQTHEHTHTHFPFMLFLPIASRGENWIKIVIKGIRESMVWIAAYSVSSTKHHWLCWVIVNFLPHLVRVTWPRAMAVRTFRQTITNKITI